MLETHCKRASALFHSAIQNKKYGATVKSGFDLELEFEALKACWLLIDVEENLVKISQKCVS